MYKKGLACRSLSQSHSPPLGLISPLFKIPLFIFKNLISPPLEPLQKFNSPPLPRGGKEHYVLCSFFSASSEVFSVLSSLLGAIVFVQSSSLIFPFLFLFLSNLILFPPPLLLPYLLIINLFQSFCQQNLSSQS